MTPGGAEYPGRRRSGCYHRLVGSRSQSELGHGVRVTASPGGGLSVVSSHLDLGWQPPAGRAPGTAVIFGGEAYEVRARGPCGGGTRWILRPLYRRHLAG